MSLQTREELVEAGLSLPAGPLADWVRSQLDAAKGKERKLAARGLGAEALAKLSELLSHVLRRQREMGDAYETPTPALLKTQALREEAAAYWRELKLMAWAAFGARPDLLALFRTGVRSGLTISNLLRELELALPHLREHAGALEPLGAGDGFRQQGRALVERLGECRTLVQEACRALPPTVAQQCHDKGLLYDGTRGLVRTARLAFHAEPAVAEEFTLARVEVTRGPKSRRRRRSLKAEPS